MSAPPDGESSPYYVSIQTSLMHGAVHEQVFNNGQKISEIKWELKQIVLSGFTIASRMDKRFGIQFGYQSGINDHLGSVEDSDFDNGSKTSFSSHASELERAYVGDFKMDYLFSKRDNVPLAGFLGYSLRRIKIGAKDGYIESPPGSTPEEVFGLGITYDQIYRFPYIGLSLRHTFSPKWESKLFIYYSNWVHIETIDSHFKRNIDFYDKMKNGVYIAIAPSATFRLSPFSAIALSAAYMKMNDVLGESYMVNTSTGVRSATRENGAGVGFSGYMVDFSWIIAVR